MGQEYTVQADVWALGMTLIELATGEFPYPPMSIFEQLQVVVQDPPPTLPAGKFSAEFNHFVNVW